MRTDLSEDLSSTVGAHLPYLRRYARALTGNQGTGDRYAAATLEAIVAAPDMMRDGGDGKVALFRTFHAVWSSAGAPLGEPDTRL